MGEAATFDDIARWRGEDRSGLAVAVLLHVALLVVLALQWSAAPEPVTERMTVSLAGEVALEATAPDPIPESRAALAPTLSDVPAPEAAPEAEDAPSETAPPEPARPAAREAAPDRERSRPDRRSQPQEREAPRQPAREEPAGGSRIGENFLEGAGSSTTTDETSAPAARFGPAERAALSSAITRQLRRHWTAPSGADAEKLVSIVSWQLNPDGGLKGRPSCRTVPSSITASNRPQVSLHCERAIRAVQLAAPFRLPEQFYSRWDDLEWQFDRRL